VRFFRSDQGSQLKRIVYAVERLQRMVERALLPAVWTVANKEAQIAVRDIKSTTICALAVLDDGPTFFIPFDHGAFVEIEFDIAALSWLRACIHAAGKKNGLHADGDRGGQAAHQKTHRLTVKKRGQGAGMLYVEDNGCYRAANG
jgi:hypothetical protein